MTYALRVKFKSNEAPWSGGYEPAERHQPQNDEAAIEWAVAMSDGLGLDYLVTLTKDDVVIPLPIRQRCAKCGLDKRRTCDGQGWLDAIGPKSDGSYITTRPCPNDR